MPQVRHIPEPKRRLATAPGATGADTLTQMRVLVVTNFEPDAAAPQRGRWVRDQIDEVRRRGIDVDVFSFPPGRREYIPATRRLRALLRRERFDLVHAHYGLPGWCARLAGARPLIVTFHGTDVRHGIVGPLSRRLAWRVDLVASVSRSLFELENGRPGLPPVPGSAVLPCGPDLTRFGPVSRAEARKALGLDPGGRFLFFPANPARPEKRHDRAAEVAAACGAELLTGGSIEPERMPLWLNAANAVLVSSDYEGFGMTAVEALACGVPVISTPVGIAPYALAGVAGCLCAPFDAAVWSAAARPHLDSPDPRVAGAERAASLSAARMAERVIEAYGDVTRIPVLD
jgi:glycosyltransferase involved in cell wall biosynthesis